MKIFTTLLFALSFLALSPAIADDTTYQASMTGIDCTGCKKKIAKALGNLDGVKTVRIAAGSGDKHTLTVITDGSSSISKSEAIAALGKNAPHYKIVSWSKTN
ncbi:MAG: heavy metal-associated domain-containing protein [Verrucomicrobiales bacterium]|nr:heavy metal-associated domain-containing protein [Verrucomicrobiales bacterium]